ncbi:head-tail connector protein [Clostridium sp. DSM 100503]|uniref:head-tail connector protein n=1 Tax=Clostridium sp. DSM 100503 TaxID=2963282 RepID=UPI002149E319|nr:head-tail connector protein [Clostridium sp. DSM 100503]MCR1952999.1 head-tail connector protein [Clostridium sp. DSM 100503]
MFEKIKRNLRISIDAFDEDIRDLIEASKKDMKSHGVKKIEEDDPLIIRAVDLYCKGHFYLDNKDAERYLESYESLRDHLSLAGDYSNE